MKNIFKNNSNISKIVTREELLKNITDNGLYGIETNGNSNTKQILMKSNKLDDIFKFAKANNISTIFFEYYYYDKAYFKINLEELDNKYPEEVVNILKDDIVGYNNEIDKINFETPIKLLIYCAYNGYLISIEQEDEWGENYKKDIVSGEEKMQSLFEKYQADLENYLSEKEKQNEIEREKLKQIVFNDVQFQRATNQKLRYAYINTFLKKNPKYWRLFGEHGIEAYRWIEAIWREYKDKKNNKN